jgi:predicted RecA/RadA family phage recombinase
MAKNYIKPGDHWTFTAGANTTSGQAVVIGTVLGIALCAVANGDKGEAAVEGVWELPKLSTAVIAQGARLTWDVSAGEFIVASAAVGDLENCAVAEAAAGNGTTTVRAKLCPGAGTVKAS